MPEEFDDTDEFVWEKIPKDAILGSYLVLTEVLTEDGIHMVVTAREGTQPWTAMGMLMFAQDAIAGRLHDGESFEVDLDEDDEYLG